MIRKLLVTGIAITLVATSAVTAANAGGRYGGLVDLAQRFSKSSTGETAGGSVQTWKAQPNGGTHTTSYNSGAGVHFSQDVTPDGTVTGRHWTDHQTGNKVGDRD